MSGALTNASPLPFPAEPPFFILGSGRSGTTLLQNILSAHSRLAVTPETHFCKLAERLSGVPIDADPPDLDAWWAAYCGTSRFASVGVSAERAREILGVGPERSFRAALAAILAAFAECTGKPRIGEKTPGHFLYARWLLDSFPEARLIVMRRDPRAVIASHARTPWRKADFSPAGSWVNRATRLHVLARDARWWAHVNGCILPPLEDEPRAMFVTYESLACDPERVVREVCAFLGEAFEPAMLGVRRNREAAADAGGAGWSADWADWAAGHHAAASAPVSAASLGKWRRDLTPLEIATIESRAGEVMRRLGYRDFAAPPLLRQAGAALAAAAGAADRAERRARPLARPLLRR